MTDPREDPTAGSANPDTDPEVIKDLDLPDSEADQLRGGCQGQSMQLATTCSPDHRTM